MSSDAREVVITATLKDVVEVIVDDTNVPVNLTGASQVPRLQGVSQDIPTTLDIAGVVTDAPNGEVTFASIGTALTTANLTDESKDSALFLCRVKYWNAAGKFDYGEEFVLRFVLPPI